MVCFFSSIIFLRWHNKFTSLDKFNYQCIINTIMKMKKPRSIQKPKTRYAKELFTRDTPYGHKVQRDRTKTLPRKQKYKEDLSDK